MLLGVFTVLAGISATSSMRAASDQAGVSNVHAVDLGHATNGFDERVLRFQILEAATDDEERSPEAALAHVDKLVDPMKLDEAMSDVTKMKTLFKQWDEDAMLAKKVIERLSANRHTFAKYSFLVLSYNGYRIKVAENAAKLHAREKMINDLVSPAKLNAALRGRTEMKELFKQWNVDEAIAMQVISRLAADPQALTTYTPLILNFNAYRVRVAGKA
ncbi:unnamed protein product [Phytophthora fragariaefolia]|uniref:RxLR effector protein n=1 Tax=Phytophthora fragariaefolia TaxID=1490495 RepID=A0A9W6XPG9_9STRA|nr:unnamed protein product [Phytophthora fragariaefolia]